MLTVSFAMTTVSEKETNPGSLVRCCPVTNWQPYDFHRFTVLYCQKLFCLRYRSFFAKIYDLSNYLEK